MKSILLASAIFLAVGVLAAPATAVPSRQQHLAARTAEAPRLGAPIDDRTPNPPSRRASTRAARKGRRERTRPGTKTVRIVAAKVPRRELAEARKQAALEQAQAHARAEELYAASQANAPIIVDAKACRRVGAGGESIYENCGLAAANAGPQ